MKVWSGKTPCTRIKCRFLFHPWWGICTLIRQFLWTKKSENDCFLSHFGTITPFRLSSPPIHSFLLSTEDNCGVHRHASSLRWAGDICPSSSNVESQVLLFPVPGEHLDIADLIIGWLSFWYYSYVIHIFVLRHEALKKRLFSCLAAVRISTGRTRALSETVAVSLCSVI